MFEIEKWIVDFFLYADLIDKACWKKVFDEMAVHTRKAIPERILNTRRPNEEDQVYNYRILNYEPITYGSMGKAFDSLFRLMNGINYTLQIPDELRKYINERRFQGMTLETYLSSIGLKRDIEDPNGFLLWYPSGEGMFDSSKKVNVKPALIYCYDLHYADEEVFSFLSWEKSKVLEGRKEAMKGDVYWIFTKTSFYKYVQVGRAKDKDFELQLVYNHNQNEIPVIVLGGDMNAEGYYESFFAPYCAFGNEAIRQFSDWQAALTTTVHPHVEEFVTECELKIERLDANNPDPSVEKYRHKIEFKPNTKSPHNTTYRAIPSGNEMGGVLDVNVPMKRFNAPPVENAKYSGESWQLLLEKAEDALHLNLGQSNQSGVAKEIDKEAHYSMITKIANNYFDNIMLKSLVYIYGYVFPLSDQPEISINKPTTFKVKTEGDMIDEIGTLTEKKVPSIFMSSATMDLAKKYFSGDQLKQKIFEIVSKYDPLFVYTKTDLNEMLANTVIQKEEYIRSVYMYGLLLQIAEDKGQDVFIKMTPEKILEEFEKLIVNYYPEEQTPLFNNEGQDNYDA